MRYIAFSIRYVEPEAERRIIAIAEIVKSLVEGRLTWDAEPMETGARVPEDGVLRLGWDNSLSLRKSKELDVFVKRFDVLLPPFDSE